MVSAGAVVASALVGWAVAIAAEWEATAAALLEDGGAVPGQAMAAAVGPVPVGVVAIVDMDIEGAMATADTVMG